MTFETAVADDALCFQRPGTRWLSTGHSGGFCRADAACVLSVPVGFDRTDLDAYVAQRLDQAGFDAAGPALLTGVDVADARGARAGPVTVVATAGLSNPAALPMDPDSDEIGDTHADTVDGGERPAGTVNLLVGTTRALDRGALATLLATAVEAKTATLQAATGFTGTTSDAVAVGCDPDGDSATFAGSATTVGAATRACVREAVTASLTAHYDGASPPASVAAADHGVRTDRRASVFRPGAIREP